MTLPEGVVQWLGEGEGEVGSQWYEGMELSRHYCTHQRDTCWARADDGKVHATVKIFFQLCNYHSVPDFVLHISKICFFSSYNNHFASHDSSQ